MSTSGPGSTRRLHLVLGWCSLLVFVILGVGLEAMHGFKVAWYVNSGKPETTRLLWRLAHAHGTMLSLVHLAFAWSVVELSGFTDRTRFLASRSFLAAGVLIPAGFFLGGFPPFVRTEELRLGTLGGDPGLGIVLLPLGALLLIMALSLAARASLRTRPEARSGEQDETAE